MKITITSIALAATLHFLPTLVQSQAQCAPITNVKTTFYGWDDNGPPVGAANAFDCGRGKGPDGQPIAGGTGSYEDPISLATATNNKNLPQCGIIYVPKLQKYFRNEDDCAACNDDWTSTQTYHVDFWTGSNQHAGGKGLNDCETSLDGGSVIINAAPSGLPVDPTPLYGDAGCNHKTYDVPSDTSSLCAGGNSNTNGNGNRQNNRLAQTTLVTSASAPPSNVPNGRTGEGSTGCEWEGHCAGATCQTYDDCSGDMICGDQGTCVES